jgi:EmrB/QacA subfamily drug resistance transporter
MEQTAAAAKPAQEFRLLSIMVPLISIIAGVFMVVLDGTAMNVALPKLTEDFHTTLPTLQWSITGYMLAQASVIPLAGWLSDRYGAKNIFLLSVLMFTLGSALCATPNSAEWLIVFRIIQGIGGGCVLPVAMAYIYRISPPDKVGVVMGMMGIPILFAPAIGPVLAGWLVEYHSWRWIFLINIPVGIVAILFGIKSLPKVEHQGKAGLDLLGVILGPLAFAALLYGVSEGAHSWTSDKTLTGLIVGGIALIAFIIVELRVRTPLLELRVFGSVDFSIGIFVQWVVQFAMFGAIFLLPLFLQNARGYGAFDTGLILLPQALASGLIMPIGGYLFDKIGARWLVVVGLGLVSVAIYQYYNVDVTTTGRDLLVPLILSGAGMGLMMMPLNTHLMNKSPRKLVSRVTSLTNALQQVINSLAVAALVTILTSRMTSRMAELQAAAGATGAAPKPADMTPEMKQAMLGAAVKAFSDTFSIMVYIAIAGALMGLLLRRDRKRPGSDAEAAATEGHNPPPIMH